MEHEKLKVVVPRRAFVTNQTWLLKYQNLSLFDINIEFYYKKERKRFIDNFKSEKKKKKELK